MYGQGCQMVSFQTKNPNLCKFLRVLDWKVLMYLMAIWNILLAFGIFYDHLVHFSGFGIMYKEKPGNPVSGSALFSDNLCFPTFLKINTHNSNSFTKNSIATWHPGGIRTHGLIFRWWRR
jgi:hypothetical protein